VRPSHLFDSPFHTNVSHLAKVMLSFLLGFELQHGPPEIGIMVLIDGRGSFWPSIFAGIGGADGPLNGGGGGAMGCCSMGLRSMF
jgi:hypothetical protein